MAVGLSSRLVGTYNDIFRSLQWLHSIREPEGQLARWMERLQEYDFEIQHRKGHHHQNADALSRYPTHSSDQPLTEDVHPPDTTELFPMCPITQCPVTAHQFCVLTERSISDLQQLQQDDDVVGPILKAVIEKERPSRTLTRGKDRKFYLLLQQWDQLYIEQGLLFRRYEDCHGKEKWAQWVVPLALQKEILSDLHSGAVGGHLGEDKTLNRLRERFYWPGHTEDVHKWCQQCTECAMRKTPVPKQRAKLTNILPSYPLQLVAVDLLGPLPESSQKNSYVLVVSDYFTRWTEAYALPNQEAGTVAKKLVDEFLFRFSLPEQLHSDQGRQFESRIIKELAHLLQIRKTRTTPYHPQSDGLVERFNRTLLAMLSTAVADHPWDWEDQLRSLCYAYNSSVHASTGYTPFFLMFGRQARLPVDLAFQLPNNQPVLHNDYVVKLQQTLQDSYKVVRDNLNGNLNRQKEIYDKKSHGHPYQKGELIWLFNPVIPPGKSKKFHKPWTGPYTVVKKLSDSTYRIQHTKQRAKRCIVHFDRLKPCKEVNPLQCSSNVESNASCPQPTQFQAPTLQIIGESDSDNEESDHQPLTSGEQRRYPARSHHPPARLTDFVRH